ncbi:hypothetical protein CSING_09905 [Corynebacterium singulare]|uniref:Uncharacterized protein n=1 Tax=Corynebacterium singulare TaxID=161899 RepID=A0A0B6F2T0_9CORY|nr:hypothetical protein CSING_09905 [Corynebacterium singulare]
MCGLLDQEALLAATRSNYISYIPIFTNRLFMGLFMQTWYGVFMPGAPHR